MAERIIQLLDRMSELLGRKSAFLDVIEKFQLRPGSGLEVQFCREQVAELNGRIDVIKEKIDELSKGGEQ